MRLFATRDLQSHTSDASILLAHVLFGACSFLRVSTCGSLSSWKRSLSNHVSLFCWHLAGSILRERGGCFRGNGTYGFSRRKNKGGALEGAVSIEPDSRKHYTRARFECLDNGVGLSWNHLFGTDARCCWNKSDKSRPYDYSHVRQQFFLRTARFIALPVLPIERRSRIVAIQTNVRVSRESVNHRCNLLVSISANTHFCFMTDMLFLLVLLTSQ